MGKLTRSELVERTGMRASHVNTYVSRGKLVEDEDRLFDEDNPVNAEFIAKRLLKVQKVQGDRLPTKSVESPVKAKETASKKPKQSKKQTTKKSSAKKPEEKVIKHEIVSTVEDYESLERKKLYEFNENKRKIEIELKEAELEKRRLELEKRRGESVPTEYVIDIVQALSDGLRNAYHDATETVIILFGNRKKMDSEDISYVKKQLNPVLNKAVDEGFEEASKRLKTIAREFSQTRGVGESK